MAFQDVKIKMHSLWGPHLCWASRDCSWGSCQWDLSPWLLEKWGLGYDPVEWVSLCLGVVVVLVAIRYTSQVCALSDW